MPFVKLVIFQLENVSNEDVTIGSWMHAMNVHHEDNRVMCHPQCKPTSIAVWDIPKCSGRTGFTVNSIYSFETLFHSSCDAHVDITMK